jgi:hypothetical protein
MRTTRRSRWPLGPQLDAYRMNGIRALDQLFSLPVFGARVQAVHRARALWLNSHFVEKATDPELLLRATEFYECVVPAPWHCESINRHPQRLRRGIAHLIESQDHWATRVQRCLNNEGAYSIPGIGAAFWSAIAQGCDPLRLPSWTRDTATGARRLGLIRRKHIWYGDLIGACETVRQRDPRLTASHVDHFFTHVARQRPGERSASLDFRDPIPALLAADRARCSVSQRLAERRTRLASARTAMLLALRSDDEDLAIGALESVDAQLGARARAWDAGALLKWIAWIWHDDDPLGELAACEQRAIGAGVALAAAVLHLRCPERFPLWDGAAAATLARLAEAPADGYPLYVEATAAFCRRYDIHICEAPGLLARLGGRVGVTT